jgi:NAD(P)-dependent dehydrogenase (short-subunit alcohol dehydrogenase family)
MGVNLDGVDFGTHAVLEALRANPGPDRGAIVATASLAGLTAVPMEPIYSANKHAVVGLARALGPALAAEGIRFNALCPSFAESAMTAPIREGLEAAGFALIPAEVVAETVVRLFALDASGECWFVQLGREPAPFAFRNVPGPRTVPPSEES